MLQNDFYTTTNLQYDESQLTATLHLNSQHEIYKGHFPNQPVVPGVCMVQIVKELAELTLAQSLMMSEAKQIKFLELIDPHQTKEMRVEMKWSKLNEGISMDAVFKINERIVFKFQGFFMKMI